MRRLDRPSSRSMKLCLSTTPRIVIRAAEVAPLLQLYRLCGSKPSTIQPRR